TSEYEARTRGLTRPVPPSSPLSVTLVADSQGHFLVEPIVNGVRLRMLVDTGASLVAISREDAPPHRHQPRICRFPGDSIDREWFSAGRTGRAEGNEGWRTLSARRSGRGVP